jgi:ferredoxin-NADP reductase
VPLPALRAILPKVRSAAGPSVRSASGWLTVPSVRSELRSLVPRSLASLTVPSVRSELRSLVPRSLASLTAPYLPDDFLALLDPLWSASDPCARVEAVRRETADTTTLVLRPGRAWAEQHGRGRPGAARAGQFLPVGVEVDGVRTWRTYSLTSAPGAARLAVTVKAVPGGRVSERLAHGTAPGEILRLGPPGGGFVLPEAAPGPLLFVTAGSGITPVAAMLRALTAQGPAQGGRGLDAVLVHSARHPHEVIFGAELRALAARTPGLRLVERHTAAQGRLSPADLALACPDWATRDTYACGPEPLLAALEAHWAAAGLADRLHVERFRLPGPAAGRAGSAGRVRFARSGRVAAADGRTPLLEVGERAGVAMPHGCRQGVCHGCLALLRSGRVRDLRDGREHAEPGESVQTCVTVPVGAVELDL